MILNTPWRDKRRSRLVQFVISICGGKGEAIWGHVWIQFLRLPSETAHDLSIVAARRSRSRGRMLRLNLRNVGRTHLPSRSDDRTMRRKSARDRRPVRVLQLQKPT